MRDVPEKSEQEHIAHAVHRLFHLQSDEKDAAASIAAST
jgi:hypothetical protein